jgi:RNA-directed DNA polymerase
MKKDLKDVCSDFLHITTRRQLAGVLGVEFKNLAYNLYKLNDDEKYKIFLIKKRNGGTRQIIAPVKGIKNIQRNLAAILLNVFETKFCVHGYTKNKNIITNASIHVRKKYIINIDLHEFFPSVNFGRVRGVFLRHPFNFNSEIATTLAQICCYKGFLPQGAPTSPVVSNYICRRLDNNLLEFSKINKVHYTRYADDITFSSNHRSIPAQIGNIQSNTLLISENLNNIVLTNGFEINSRKTRYANKDNRQEVTGLIVNKFPNVKRKYIRHVRAMLNAWEKFGIDSAASEHFEKYNHKTNVVIYPELSYQREVRGKIAFIGQVKGKEDDIYIKLLTRLKRLMPEVKLSIVKRYGGEAVAPTLFGEGKTDWKHCEAALNYFRAQGEFIDLDILFKNYGDGLEINNAELLKICESLSKTGLNPQKVICLFDRDDETIKRKVVADGKLYKHWGNNVYSVLLPIPAHRKFEQISIEHFYTDEDLKTKDENGRRLYLSNEFDQNTGLHLTDQLVHVNKVILKTNYMRLIDSRVFKDNGTNVALSKNNFAENIHSGNKLFQKISFKEFKILFQQLKEVIEL